MIITVKDKDIKELLAGTIADQIKWTSRFKCDTEVIGASRIKIRNVRLKESKPYCGSHPEVCDVEGGRKSNCLEGADWVEFNDRINDILDVMHVSARVYTSVCEIRKDTRRRIHYGVDESSVFLRERQWDKEGAFEDYEDWCGKVAPDSWYPPGTPGLYERVPPFPPSIKGA